MHRYRGRHSDSSDRDDDTTRHHHWSFIILDIALLTPSSPENVLWKIWLHARRHQLEALFIEMVVHTLRLDPIDGSLGFFTSWWRRLAIYWRIVYILHYHSRFFLWPGHFPPVSFRYASLLELHSTVACLNNKLNKCYVRMMSST
jgi:hypothetical protein